MKIIHEEFVRDCRRKIIKLEKELAMFKERLRSIEDVVPGDHTSVQYEQWEEQCQWLKEQIFNAEAEVSELEEVVELELRP